MDALVSVVAHFCRTAVAVPAKALRFDGAFTVFPSQYDGGSETASAAIKVGSGKSPNVVGMLVRPAALAEYAGRTQPQGLYSFTLEMTADDGTALFALRSLELAEGMDVSKHITATCEAPVVTQVTRNALSILWNSESESHLDLAAPAGMAWNPALEQAVGLTLPSLEIAFERRLVEGDVQNPVRARAVGGDKRLWVPANPMADLSTILA